MMFFMVVVNGYSCASTRRPVDMENRSSLNPSLFPWGASPAWSGGTVGEFLSIQSLMLFWGATLSNCLHHQMRVPPPSHACTGWLRRRSCPALDTVCALPTFLVTHGSMTKNPSQALLAATAVGVLWEMNKWFVKSLPLSHLEIREALRLVSHLGLLFFMFSCPARK